jgi:hypothetical protein
LPWELPGWCAETWSCHPVTSHGKNVQEPDGDPEESRQAVWREISGSIIQTPAFMHPRVFGLFLLKSVSAGFL